MLTIGPRNRKGDQGDAGKDGSDGKDGSRGSFWFSDSGKPSSDLGQVDNDQYLNTDNGDVYQVIASKWVLTGNIRGPKGKDGKAGPRGPQGQQGDPGSGSEDSFDPDTILTGPTECLFAGPTTPQEVLIDNNGNVLIGL